MNARIRSHTFTLPSVNLLPAALDSLSHDDVERNSNRIEPLLNAEQSRLNESSFTATLVSDGVALLRSIHPDLSIPHLRAILLQSARGPESPGRDSLYEFGLDDAGQAVEELSTSMG